MRIKGQVLVIGTETVLGKNNDFKIGVSECVASDQGKLLEVVRRDRGHQGFQITKVLGKRKKKIDITVKVEKPSIQANPILRIVYCKGGIKTLKKLFPTNRRVKLVWQCSLNRGIRGFPIFLEDSVGRKTLELFDDKGASLTFEKFDTGKNVELVLQEL